MLRTGASLVVGDGGFAATSASAELLDNASDQHDYYAGRVDTLEDLPRRRKPANNTRKRKRRPQYASDEYWRGQVEDDIDTAATAVISTRPRKRKQPAIREPLAALEKEQKLYELRDKQRQEMHSLRDKSYRRPYAQAKKEANSAETLNNANGSGASAKTSSEMKQSYKHPSDMSINEKGMSLDDLLKGKKNALLLLQNTATPSALPSSSAETVSAAKTNAKRIKPARRYQAPTTTVPEEAAYSESYIELDNNNNNNNNKFKMATPLQRLKFFGSSSTRAANMANMQAATSGATTRRAMTSGSTTPPTTTTSTLATTRIPLYKKHLFQRPTLKPPSLLKVPAISTIPTAPSNTYTTYSSVTTTTAKEVPTTSPEILTTEHNLAEEETEQGSHASEVPTVTKNEVQGKQEDPESQTDDEQEDDSTDTESYLKDEEEEPALPNTTINSEKPTTSTISSTSTTTTTTSSPQQSTKAITRDVAPLNAKPSQRVQANLKTNSIENEESVPENNSASGKQLQNYADSDGLENFFEETTLKAREGLVTTTEHITPRIDHLTTEKAVATATNDIRKSSSGNFNLSKPSINSKTNDYSYQEVLPDFDGIDDRTDLLELIEDRRSGNRLFKVLEQRNMTLEELIEHRKRGSSQLHLATVVQNRSRFFPGQKVVLQDNMDIVTAFENFPHFNLMDLKSVKPDDIKTDSQGASYFTSIIDIEPTDEVYKDEPDKAFLQSQRSEKSVNFFPSWKTLALASLASTTTRDVSTKHSPFYLPQPQLFLESTDSSAELDDEDYLMMNETNVVVGDSLQPQQHQHTSHQTAAVAAAIDDTVEAIENEVAHAHDLIDLELSGHGFKRSPAAAATALSTQPSSIYSQMPAGIRSAIVASAAIVLTSLMTFMFIFVVCRWKQRRQRRTNYAKTYNAMKSKLPTITAGGSRRSSLRCNMEELVGGSGGGSACGISTVSVTPVHQHHQLQRQSSLLFPRSNDSNELKTTSMTTESSAMKQDNGYGRGKTLLGCGIRSLTNSGGIGSRTGSTTSLALSLQSVQNISTNKLNTMDPNSPEVQEYLFDALRKSF